LNTILTQLVWNVLSPYVYDTKDVQILYSIKCSDLFFHISTSKYFESTFLSLYQKQFHFFIGFWVDNLFCLFYLADTPPFKQKIPLTSLEDPKFPCIFMKMKKTSNIINYFFMKWSWLVYISHTNKINTTSLKWLQLWDDPNFTTYLSMQPMPM